MTQVRKDGEGQRRVKQLEKDREEQKRVRHLEKQMEEQKRQKHLEKVKGREVHRRKKQFEKQSEEQKIKRVKKKIARENTKKEHARYIRSMKNFLKNHQMMLNALNEGFIIIQMTACGWSVMVVINGLISNVQIIIKSERCVPDSFYCGKCM